MKKLLPCLLALCFLFPQIARGCPPSPNDPTASDTTIYIKKDSSLNRYTAIRIEWQLMINGVIAQKGVIPVLELSSRRPTPLHLPAKLPAGNKEAILRLVYTRVPARSRKATPDPILTRLIPVRPWKGDYAIPQAGDLTFTDSNDIFTIASASTLLRFDKQTGWLLRYEADRIPLMEDSAGLRPALWPPAITQPHLQLFSTSTGNQLVIVRAEYTLPEVSCLLHMSYTINAAGEMLVGQSVEADTTRQATDSARPPPALPGFGMTWILPAGLDSITWCGPPSADTRARTTDFNGVRWWTITRPDGRGMRMLADSAFLHLRLNGQQMNIDRPVTSDPLVDVNEQYTYKIVPVLPDPAKKNHTRF